MSALHYGRFNAVPNTAGRLVYTAMRVEHALPGFPKPATPAVAKPLIPAQRRETNTAQAAPEGAAR